MRSSFDAARTRLALAQLAEAEHRDAQAGEQRKAARALLAEVELPADVLFG